MIEAAGVSLALTIFLSGLLLVSYVLFARAWIQYQSEQALYCLAEASPAEHCRQQLERNLARFLPYGEVHGLSLYTSGDRWNLQLQWRFKWYALNVHKHLSPRIIAKNNKDLHS